MNGAPQLEADPPGLCLSVGAGRESTSSRIVPLKPSAAMLVEALKALPGVREGWFAFHRWRTGRKAPDWQSASGTIVDLDHHMHDSTGAKPKGIKAPPPLSWREKLQALIESGGLPGNVFHHTANGERVYLLFGEAVTDEATYRRSYHGACALVRKALETAGVPLSVNAGDGKGYEVDPSVEDLAQWFWSPRALVDGQKRDGAPVVLREEPYSPAELATAAPLRPDGGRRTAKVVTNGARSRSVYPTLDAARDAFNRDHAVDWGPPGKGTCPICGHNDCFGSLPERPGKWFCFSEGHSGEGQRAERGWFGDALDVAAHEAGQSTVDQLRAEEYLAAEYREEPGCNDGDEPPAPESENPPGPGNASADRTDASSQFQPFSGAKVPPFPVEALPPPLARYVEALATHLQVPADGPALMALAVLAAACAKRFQVRRLADRYEQPLNLYLLGLGEPGERKSQIVAEVVRPLRANEAREAERLADQIAIERQTRQLDEDRMKVIRRTLASGKVRGDPKALRAELDDLTLAMAKPALRAPRLVTSSPTSGALEQLLAENGERMAILSAEGGAFGIVAGRFAGNSKAPPDMDVYLSAWSGDAGDADRVSREGTRLKAPALTIGMFVQPQVLREVSSIYGSGEKGLTARFLIANVQPCADRQQYLGPPMDEERRDAWGRSVEALLGSLPEQEQVIVLRTEILGPAKQFFDEVTPQMAPGGPMSGTVLRAFASKLRGQVERLVGVLHVAEHGPAAADMPCSEATVSAAATVARYFLAHGKAALGEAGADPVLDRARRVVDYLVYNRIATFTRRDVQIGKWGGCRKPEQVDETLDELETRGYLTKTFAKRKKPGANGPVYHLRPGLFR